MPKNSSLKRQFGYPVTHKCSHPSVFIPIDLTKWNRSHCWVKLSFLNVLSKKKVAKANSKLVLVGYKHPTESVWNNFPYLNRKLTVTKKFERVGVIAQAPPPHLRKFTVNSSPFRHPRWSAERVTYRAFPTPSSRFPPWICLFLTFQRVG